MRNPFRKLFWSSNNNEIDKLAQRGVTASDVYDAVFGCEDEESMAHFRRIEYPYVKIYGQTGNGRLLKIVGEDMLNGALRVFHAIDMNEAEKKFFRRKGK